MFFLSFFTNNFYFCPLGVFFFFFYFFIRTYNSAQPFLHSQCIAMYIIHILLTRISLLCCCCCSVFYFLLVLFCLEMVNSNNKFSELCFDFSEFLARFVELITWFCVPLFSYSSVHLHTNRHSVCVCTCVVKRVHTKCIYTYIYDAHTRLYSYIVEMH